MVLLFLLCGSNDGIANTGPFIHLLYLLFPLLLHLLQLLRSLFFLHVRALVIGKLVISQH